MTKNNTSDRKVMHVARATTLKDTLRPTPPLKRVGGSVHSVKAEDLLKFLEKNEGKIR